MCSGVLASILLDDPSRALPVTAMVVVIWLFDKFHGGKQK